MPPKSNHNHIQEPITKAPPEVREIIQQVLQLEKDKLYWFFRFDSAKLTSKVRKIINFLNENSRNF